MGAIITKEIALRAVLYGACKIPPVGVDIKNIPVKDLGWAESCNLITSKEKVNALGIDAPLWVFSGSGSGTGSGYGTSYSYGDRLHDGSGSGTSNGSGSGSGFGTSFGNGYGYGEGYGEGDGSGYSDDDGDGSGCSDRILTVAIEQLI